MTNTDHPCEDTRPLPDALVPRLAREFNDVLAVLDRRVPQLVAAKQWMAAAALVERQRSEARRVHSELCELDRMVFDAAPALLQLRDAEWAQLRRPELVPVSAMLSGPQRALEYDENEDQVEVHLPMAGFLRRQYRAMGLRNEHWAFDKWFIYETHYLFSVLNVFVEPSFVADAEVGQSPSRHIPADVKRAVWRRDRGCCVG